MSADLNKMLIGLLKSPKRAGLGTSNDATASAWLKPINGFEKAMTHLILGIDAYRRAHLELYGSGIAEDGEMGVAWEDIVRSVKAMLAGEAGRLDRSILDQLLNKILEEEGVDAGNPGNDT